MVISHVSTGAPLGDSQIRSVIEQLLVVRPLDGRRVLAIIPDHSRSGPTGTFFRLISETLGKRAKQLDFLIALGTHAPMSDEKIAGLLQMTTADRLAKFTKIGVYNHRWNDPSALRQVGTLSRGQVEELSNGMLSLDVPVLLNKMVFDYDHLLICGPIFPHEVVGFSGGHKYLFPGIAAPQIINFTHWLGALITNPVINGTRNTPVRAAIEAAADMVPIERSLIGYVVEGRDARGVFAGPVREAWHAATELSEKLQIVYREKPYHTVLSCAPTMYDDIWTAGKCMYKLEPVVADGGTLIIHGPHIGEVSYSHGQVLDQVGYHVRDYFVKQWDRFKEFPWGVLAHSTHVKGVGQYEGGKESPRVNVVLATRIPEQRCRRINLGYVDPDSINPAEYTGREDEGVLQVPEAGEILYRLRDMSKFGE
ncbi:MAG: lactate racemase domain-containing protein [Phycisphaerae bacterium]|nr:lactate racemase domain-containing protein [Phycisphaerae bacterium]